MRCFGVSDRNLSYSAQHTVDRWGLVLQHPLHACDDLGFWVVALYSYTGSSKAQVSLEEILKASVCTLSVSFLVLNTDVWYASVSCIVEVFQKVDQGTRSYLQTGHEFGHRG